MGEVRRQQPLPAEPVRLTAMRIAVGGIHTESSTYSPVFTTAADFRVCWDGALLAHAQFAMLAPFDAEFVPLLHARAIPGGPVERAAYNALKAEFLTRLAQAGRLDGLYLAMHGAMHVDGLDDAEGDWIGAARAAVGPDLPIAVSYDLHGNVTPRIVDAIDIFAAYRTAPHTDVAATQSRAVSMLLRSLATGQKPCVALCVVPVLLPGERTSTEDEPARSLYARLADCDARHGIWDSNIMVGYVWADEPRATASVVLTGTDRAAMAAAAGELACAYFDARTAFRFGPRTGSIAECVAWAMASDTGPSNTGPSNTGPVILADSGDNPTGGGVGDRPDVLAELIRAGCRDAVVAGIADAPATEACFAAGVGADLTLSIGASLDRINASPLVATGNVATLNAGVDAADRRAVFEAAGIRIVLTARRRPFHDLADFTTFGIDPTRERLIVVKSGYLSPELAPLAAPNLMALSPGVVEQDMARLPARRIRRPMFPFDTDFTYQPEIHFSKRCQP